MKFREYANKIDINPAKLTNYALDPDNPKGKNKAKLFQDYLGFTQTNHQSLIDQIYQKALDSEAIPQQTDQYGTRYQVDIAIQGISPTQKENVRTGWLIPPNSKNARLITAYIKRKP